MAFSKQHTIKAISKQPNIYVYIVFLLSPLFALILSINNFRQSWSKNIVWLYTAFFGFTFVIGNIHSDVNRYRDQFREMVIAEKSVAVFFSNLFKESGGTPDYIQPTIFYILSKFTEDFRIVLGVFGLIFGYFFAKNIWNILELATVKITKASILFILVFSSVYAIWDINVLRFTIAAHIFFYGAFAVLVKEKKSGYLFAALSFFMHFSLSLAFILLLIYKYLKPNPKVFVGFFIASLFVSEIDFQAVRNIAAVLPDSYVTEVNEYVNEDFLEYRTEQNEEKNWRGKSYQPAIKWATTILLLYIFFRRRHWLLKNKKWLNYYCYVLLYLTVFNILNNIPVMNRFLFIGYMLALCMFFVYFLHNKNYTDNLVCLVTAPMLLFFAIMKFRIGLEFTGFFSVFGNPFTAYFSEGDVPFISYFK
jgi:hypothetical protein